MDFIRTKQSGVQNDFTGALAGLKDYFNIEEVERYGLPYNISTLAYDPVQSLLAVATHQNGESHAEVHVFGRNRVQVAYQLGHPAAVKQLQLCDSRIIVFDSANKITIFDLRTPGQPGKTYTVPGAATYVRSDPCLDWLFIGTQTGEVIVYDLDREVAARDFKIVNFWRKRAGGPRSLPIVSLDLHPKNIDILLITYPEGSAVYSFSAINKQDNKQGDVLHYLELPAPHGARNAPRVVSATWHPTGTFVCMTHEDSTISIWNPKDGTLIAARNVDDTIVRGASAEELAIKRPISKIAWCSTSNPDDTSLLIAGGTSMAMPTTGMTLIDLGPTPITLTSSLKTLSDHFIYPRKQKILPTSMEFDVVDFCVIPKTTPHYGGGHDPMAVIALLANGELVTLEFPTGNPLSPALSLHPSLVLAHPYASRFDLTMVKRDRWLGLPDIAKPKYSILEGGAPRIKDSRRYDDRPVLQTSHPNGMVRIWDIGQGDTVECDMMIELDPGRVLQKGVDLKVDIVSMASAVLEIAVGMETGEVVMYRFSEKNPVFGHTPDDPRLSRWANPNAEDGPLHNVTMRADPTLRKGIFPVCVLDQKCGSILAVKMSDIGFCAVAYQTGHISVLDMRGPAVIFHSSINIPTKESKRFSIHKKAPSAPTEKPTALEFGILTPENDKFNFLCLFVGTSFGRVLTYKITPSPNGYSCSFHSADRDLEAAPSHNPIISITPLNSDDGRKAWATQQAFASLKDGFRTPGVIVAVSHQEVRVFKPGSDRAAKRDLDKYKPCISAAVTEHSSGIVLTTIYDGSVQNYSLPGLSAVGKKLDLPFNMSREIRIMENGHIVGWIGNSAEIAMVSIVPKNFKRVLDVLYNPDTPPIQRPTISNLQWVTGTQFVSIEDLNVIIGGVNRPEKLTPAQVAEVQASSSTGVFSDLAKRINERGEKLQGVEDSFDSLTNSAMGLSDAVSKYVGQQKKKALIGGITGKWF
ncbi:lethal giant larvae like, C-terminal-domain-containing protein [Pyronema omphalodes]|nr:lethal giant larvae like, C-terminal-domain-containing protein [Pyronema omphalodes]